MSISKYCIFYSPTFIWQLTSLVALQIKVETERQIAFHFPQKNKQQHRAKSEFIYSFSLMEIWKQIKNGELVPWQGKEQSKVYREPT